ncbi:MAG: NADH-quinone oxidoreductase subunit C [Bacillota bacterium]|jgi:NADH-quinone oxidoreductase subunit C
MGGKTDDKVESTEDLITEVAAAEVQEASSARVLPGIVEQLKQKYAGIEVNEQLTVVAPLDNLMDLMQELKHTYHLDYLTNLTAVDYPDENRFEIVYNINSIGHGYSIMVKTGVSRDNPVVPSVFPVWGGAVWQEREVYDLLGIVFTGHPNLKRILTNDGFEGHPLRKDFEWVGGRQ